MAELPKIDSEGLRLAKQVGAARVSSVVNVSKSEPRKYRLCDQTGEPCYVRDCVAYGCSADLEE